LAFLSFLNISSIWLTYARSRSGYSVYTINVVVFIARRPSQSSADEKWKSFGFYSAFFCEGKQIPRFPFEATKVLHLSAIMSTIARTAKAEAASTTADPP
jgi:hypothetical protein